MIKKEAEYDNVFGSFLVIYNKYKDHDSITFHSGDEDVLNVYDVKRFITVLQEMVKEND